MCTLRSAAGNMDPRLRGDDDKGERNDGNWNSKAPLP